MYSLNGVPFVYAASGDTYASLAKTFDLFPKEILKFNDLSLTTDMNARLQPGTLVYVQAKKKMAAKGIEKHVIEADDTLRGIAQRYGVKLESIYKMNAFDSSYVPREGDIIKLRD
jgi:LysM repeat protein